MFGIKNGRGFHRSRQDRTVHIDLLKRFISDLQTEFSGYGPSGLTKDLMAGMTVAAVALPLALAFGVSSGADAAAGQEHRVGGVGCRPPGLTGERDHAGHPVA